MMLQVKNNTTQQLFKAGLVLGVALTLAACSSQRFGSSRGGGQQSYSQPEAVEAIPSGSISSEPLSPLDGSGQTGYGMDGSGGMGMGGTNTAALPPVTSAPAQPASRFGMVGGWTAKDATGSSCRVVLSSTPTLDLYKASTSGCTNKDLAKISAWDFRDGEVYLYQTGGTMAARLRAQGSNMDGALTKSGAPLSMSR
ncbi:AprI/Inh family metalloprotease inhibitor [Microvirga sp. W0021]|uniref:AprI/Inh family metalloprotease inhibitor n=1 Tax=Hohaiivirga grylli TaxID=3133970 RepID=A0ABV0BLH8_9HYPH